jgi:hypothetical protein
LQIETLTFDDIVGVTDLTNWELSFNLDFSKIGSGVVVVIGGGVESPPPGVTDYILFDTDFVVDIIGGNSDDLFILLNGAPVSGGAGSINGLGGNRYD